MSEHNLASNPFAALFPSLIQAQEFTASFKPSNSPEPEPDESLEENKTFSTEFITLAEEKLRINKIIEDAFLITLDKGSQFSQHVTSYVFLEEVHASLKGQDWLDIECLGQAVFERLMLENPRNHVISPTGSRSDPVAVSEAGDSQTLRYLQSCYARLKKIPQKELTALISCVEKSHSAIIDNGKMCFQHPEFFPNLDVTSQFIDILMNENCTKDSSSILEFFDCITEAIHVEAGEDAVFDAFQPVLENIRNKYRGLKLGDSAIFVHLDLLRYFTRNKWLAQAFMQFNQPSDAASGHSYENTLLGAVLTISCIAKNESGPFDFFNYPSGSTKQQHDITENSIHQPVAILNEQLHQILYSILKLGDEPRHMVLSWLANCLHANAGRAKIWSRHGILPGLFNQMYCSDGFFLNLCAVLLRLCQPFSSPNSLRLLKIQPTYCLATVGQKDQLKARNVHMRDLADETFLVPPPAENERLGIEDNYNFMTECFFLTEKCINLGLHVVQEKFFRLNQDLHRVQTLYHDIMRQGGEDTEPGQRIKEQMEKGMSVFLCLKASLTEPQLLDLCFNFHIATSTYLSHLATSTDFGQFSPVTFPLSEDAPPSLASIPEFVAENIMDFTMFVRRFRDSLYEVHGNKLEHLMTFALVFMGCPKRMRNPHLRARLAETLDALTPTKDNQQGSMVILNYHREQLFHKHPLAVNLGQTLLHVFVSIEMTGQGVEFEQKFNYRRPMYQILDYIWELEIHRDAIKSLARYAEDHIEDTDSPLFLRFINLLINDAIFLLDEALQYMTQIKEKQEEKESGAWESLAPNQRQENESNLRQLSMLARFHNLMGNDTIHTIEFITREITSIFTHSVMVDRIAAMLNFFLLHLVGPKKKNLKVKDFNEVDFKPQELVSNISQIYLNLGEDDKFCAAVSGDGRSYSHDLFVQAEKVLIKINRPPDMIMQFTDFGAKVKAMANLQQKEEEAISDAPDEFLDPIMGTLMREPVFLPSSHQIVDRATIARHILSDQSDPFNRDPLTMDMVKPMNELRERIQLWIETQMAKAQGKDIADS